MNISKILVPALFYLLISCGEHQTGQQAAGVTDSSSNHPATSDSTEEDFTGANVKSDDYEANMKEELKTVPNAVKGFVPSGYAALDTATGDLNQDQYTDMLLVLKQQGEDTAQTEEPVKRPLLILTGQPDNSYRLAAKNDNAVYCNKCGGVMGDPYMGLVIKNGFFSIEHYGGSGWRWTRTVTFKYSTTDSSWYLHKDGGDSFHAADPKKLTTKVFTTKDFGKVPFEKFDIYNDKRE